MPKVGEKLVVSITLFDGDETRVPQAVVTDDVGAPLVGSPIELTHVENGYYENSVLVMPNISFVKAIITVYNDDTFAVVSPKHSSASAVYTLEVPFQEILDQFQLLITKLDQLLASEFIADLSAVVRADARFSARLMQVKKLSAKLNSIGNLTGKVVDPESLKGTATGKTLTASLKDC